jgi:hypothetical protein
MAGSGDLYAAMVEFFDACVRALADTPDGAPECRYIAEGAPAWDVCPCLVVHCGGADIGQTFPLQPALATAHRVAVQGEVDLIVLTATILRCAPSLDDQGHLPTPESHALAAQQTSADLWAIWNHLKTEFRAEVIFAPKTREFAFEPAISVNPGGGCAGWQIPLRVQLGGYRATL